MKAINTLSRFSVLLLVAVLVGCSNHITTKDGKCLTCFNNPITQKPINHAGESQSEEKPVETVVASKVDQEQPAVSEKEDSVPAIKDASFKSYEISFDIPVNVDVAFIKVKKEFAYQSEQEIRQEWGSLANTKLQTVDYAYEALPSVYYHMRAARKHDGRHMNIDTRIEKKSDKESTVILKYWPREKVNNPKAIGVSLKSRVEQALGVQKTLNSET